ncbi:hypothetical protein [Lactobacillus johnsonii]|jgi:hypothetical protein|nr:hypothetical protein [Lactobacillus johnsonii]MBF0772201.1 hypothetical protein [Lactobacillus johnsonii]MCF1583763.1 hypothetical protein [Lactobacillus johnsonii]MDG4987874.1 hypothetical protein [Lactobacillus johnsonii]QMT68833.1 hypothetical protein H0I41_04205 [Lactobacillus johnsonii]UKV65406.1 hypothetical protein LXB09_01310 [Lactobacillus johnsonii]
MKKDDIMKDLNTFSDSLGKLQEAENPREELAWSTFSELYVLGPSAM